MPPFYSTLSSENNLRKLAFVHIPQITAYRSLLRNPTNSDILDGILGTHVDDGIGGGNENFERALEKLKQSLPFGTREHSKFKFTGLDIEQLPGFSIKVNQGPAY